MSKYLIDYLTGSLKIFYFIVLASLLLILCLSSSSVKADGLVVDKVYHPLVLPFEKEIEWRLMSSQTDDVNRLGQRLGYGHGVSEKVAIAGYIVAERDLETNNFELQAFEIETRIMLTEQGEQWADWGLVLELENQNKKNDWEAAVGLVFEKEFRQTSLTLNSFLIYEWGDSLDQEFELEFRAQYRYRWLPEFQPSLELYSGEDFLGLGPSFMGVHRIQGQEQIKWELGFITEVSHAGKDHTLRMAVEYEF
jgi:hypothetical protein